MKTQVTFGHILTLLSLIIIPLIIWGINVEKRFEHVINNTEDIEFIKKENKENKTLFLKNHTEIMKGIHAIELQLKDKKDRE